MIQCLNKDSVPFSAYTMYMLHGNIHSTRLLLTCGCFAYFGSQSDAHAN